MKTIQDIFTEHLEKYPAKRSGSHKWMRNEIESIRADIAKLKVFLIPGLPWVVLNSFWQSAQTHLGEYQVGQTGEDDTWITYLDGHVIDCGFKEMDQAKSAAQEHYEATVSQGLEKAI